MEGDIGPNDPAQWIAHLQWQAAQDGKLSMWTVYDHPSDYPEEFVARQHVSDAGSSRPTPNAFRTRRLETMRMILQIAGLVPMARDPGDDKKIVETWL
jgi:hypothetical protein